MDQRIRKGSHRHQNQINGPTAWIIAVMWLSAGIGTAGAAIGYGGNDNAGNAAFIGLAAFIAAYLGTKLILFAITPGLRAAWAAREADDDDI